MRIAALAILSLLVLAGCSKSGEPAKAPTGAAAPRMPVVVEPTAPTAAPGAELPPAPPPVEAPPPPPPPSAAAPAPAESAFTGDFDLAGTEPFWNLKIRRNGLTLARLGHSDLTAPNPGFNEFGSTAMWNATAGQSRMTVTVTKAACTDGMSDRAYPYAAKVTVWGATLSGCAARPAG